MGKAEGHRSEKIFAIGDVHGCATELRTLLDKLPLTPDCTIVFVGDYIDRGAESKEVIDTILELGRSHRVVPLTGNHESMFLDFLADPRSEGAGIFIYNGGCATLASYGNNRGEFSIPQAHRAFLESLALSYQTDEFFFVHAGVPDVPIETLDMEKYRLQMLCVRKPFHRSDFTWSRKIVHGHTPVAEVELCKNRINIDTGCVHNRCLTAIELPGEVIYSTPRQPRAPRAHLRDHGSKRIAVRFEGAVPVCVYRGGEFHQLETLNYNEFGMYLRDALHGHEEIFAVGEIILGDIGSRGQELVSFQGEVVRIGKGPDCVCYAVKMSSFPTGADD